MNKSIVIVVIVVVAGLATAFLVGNDEKPTLATPDDNADPSATGSDEVSTGTSVGITIGDQAADFTVETFSGEMVSLSDFRGQPVLLDFWAGWCPFCIEEMPELEQVHQEFRDDGLVVLGVHRTETESVDTGKAFADDRGVTYPLLKDSDGAVYRFYSGGQSFMPLAYYIDEDGVIRDRVLGPKSAEQIRAAVRSLLDS